MSRRDPNEPERFPDYSEHANSHVWPSYDASDGVVLRYIEDMAPQYAASAVHKLRRWARGQYATEQDGERFWTEVQTWPMTRALQAKASGVDDFSESLEPSRGFNQHQAAKILTRMAFEGSPDDEDYQLLIRAVSRITVNLYKRRPGGSYALIHIEG